MNLPKPLLGQTNGKILPLETQRRQDQNSNLPSVIVIYQPLYSIDHNVTARLFSE